MASLDMVAFRKVLEEARDAYKTAESEAMRDWICEQVSRFVLHTLTARECLEELLAIQTVLDVISIDLPMNTDAFMDSP